MAHKLVYPKSETELKSTLDQLYVIFKQANEIGKQPKIKSLLEIAKSEVTIMTAIHNIKSNQGSKTAGTDNSIISDILEKQYPEVTLMVQEALDNYKPYLLKRVWIPKPGKVEKRPLGP